ncbi:MAG: pyridoxine 5'-phosphate synthase [Oligoflexia bacterium]|nr:pyridoxine 5'-phosphate synthase [Oligoflexia bacterium]
MIRLGLNIDHVATLRQVRAGLTAYPDVLSAAQICMQSGANQITVHLRGDRRHIQEFDVKNIISNKIPTNLEMAATDEMTKIAIKYKPLIACLVPEKREEVTTEGGLDVIKNYKKIQKCIKKLKLNNILVSLFIEPNLKQVEASADLMADAVEFHTGKYALSKSTSQKQKEYERLEKACIQANNLNLKVHAGHGIDYENVLVLKKLPHLIELNIGHSIICRSVFVGLAQAVKEMKSLLA